MLQTTLGFFGANPKRFLRFGHPLHLKVELALVRNRNLGANSMQKKILSHREMEHGKLLLKGI